LPRTYIGRFAPSPSGALHQGSLVAALASYLDARAHCGHWLLRFEDLDTPRVVAGADRVIMQQLHALGMHWDAPPTWQSHGLHHYRTVFERLKTQGQVYGCACTRAQLGRRAYPGTCRNGIAPGRTPRAWRFHLPDSARDVRFEDRWMGVQQQDVSAQVGDFIIARADGPWAYQFAVVIDDGRQHITDIVRGADLLTSTARQQVLARHLGFAPARVMHVPLVLDTCGHKLSKQNHAPALNDKQPLQALQQAWQHLGFAPLTHISTPAEFWSAATTIWAQRFMP